MAVLAHHFEEGGWGMYPILVTSIVLIGIAMERLAFLYRPRIDLERTLGTIDALLRKSGDVASALAMLSSARPIERVLRAGLRESLQPVPRIEAAVACALVCERPALRRRLGTISTLIQLATLWGLLGTITGLATGYSCVANTDASSRATMLARGISEAMNCTAAGLLVSGLGVLALAVLSARTEMLSQELSLAGAGIVNLLRDHRARLRWMGERAPLERATYREAA